MTANRKESVRIVGRVEAAGPNTVVVDGGRHGWAHLAVTRSGAYDRGAFHRANRLVGNLPNSAALEVLLGGMRVRFDSAVTVALSGVQANLRIELPGTSRAVDCESTVTLPAGCVLEIPRFHRGLRGYLAIRGGWAAEATLGSRSTDTLSGLGPAPISSGDAIGVVDHTAPFPQHDANVVAFRPRAQTDGPFPLRLLPGPRSGRYLELHEWVLRNHWRVSSASDRIGMRLELSDFDNAIPSLGVQADGTPPPSEPLVRGAVQVSPDGRPVIMGPDHPTTGGYPVIGVVTEHDCDALAQLRPGDPVLFVDIRL